MVSGTAAQPRRICRDAYAVGRFAPGGPIGYRAATAPGAVLRATRAEAEADERDHLARARARRLALAAPAR